MSQEIRAEVLELMKQKDKIESEIKELTSILTKNNVGMNEPLVDSEGFPINSIDIYQVRHARHRIICLQNDHKALMKQIENGLQGYYSAASSNTQTTSNGQIHDIEMRDHNEIIHKTPFAKVTVVSPGSPAEYAGLQQNDEIIEFGSVNSSNFSNITDIAAVVQHKENSQVNIKIKRGERFITAQLVPRKWTGRGLLGCNVDSL